MMGLLACAPMIPHVCKEMCLCILVCVVCAQVIQLAFLVACMYTGVGLLRLGFMVRFLSHSVITGFTSGGGGAYCGCGIKRDNARDCCFSTRGRFPFRLILLRSVQAHIWCPRG